MHQINKQFLAKNAVFFIAELGNGEGDFDQAKRLTKLALNQR